MTIEQFKRQLAEKIEANRAEHARRVADLDAHNFSHLGEQMDEINARYTGAYGAGLSSALEIIESAEREASSAAFFKEMVTDREVAQ